MVDEPREEPAILESNEAETDFPESDSEDETGIA